ncbi:MAG: hypothetical protein PHF31_10605 [Methylobacter sp.]|nr:hypothetical protein [Methylobacter sp.]
MKLLKALKHEIKEVGLVALYFFFSFGVLLTLKKLFLAEYQVEVHAISAAAVSALIAAKIVIVLDATHVGSRFDASFPLGLAAVYKTLVYILATFVVLYLEKLIEAYWEIGTLGQAISDVWEHRNRNIMLAKVLCVGLTFFVYHLYAGLDRRLGEGTLRRLVTAPPETAGADSEPK